VLSGDPGDAVAAEGAGEPGGDPGDDGLKEDGTGDGGLLGAELRGRDAREPCNAGEPCVAGEEATTGTESVAAKSRRKSSVSTVSGDLLGEEAKGKVVSSKVTCREMMTRRVRGSRQR
jgi:hypothetical protein